MNYPNPFTWDAPDGPSTPFATGVLVFDIMRIIVVSLCLIIAFLSVSLVLERAGTLGMKARLIGTCIAFFLYVGGTELEHFGDYAHYRLYAGFIAAVVYAWGLWSFQRWEAAPTLRTEKD